jgi:hypothetical protein
MTIPATGDAWEDGDIVIHYTAGSMNVFGKEVTVTGTEVSFLVPLDLEVTNNPIKVAFGSQAGIKNPTATGWKRLEVKTSRAPDNVYVKSASPGWRVRPCMSTYGFSWDASPTYPGIASGFVPPYKACGQDVYYEGTDNWGNPTQAPVAIPGGFQNAFYVEFSYWSRGCFAPCTTVDVYMQLTKSPQKPEGFPLSKVTFNLSSPIPFNGVLSYDATKPGTVLPNKKILIADDLLLTATTDEAWYGLIHFDTVGDYELCFWAECPGTICGCGPIPDPLAKECFAFSAKQWKDAAKIQLDEKWNLISLPLVPFDTNIDNMLASLYTIDIPIYAHTSTTVIDNFVGMWYFDPVAKTWLVKGSGQNTLTKVEDGKAYWLKLRYPLYQNPYGEPIGPPFVSPPNNCGNYSWWVFGTALPEPPNSPKVYPVVAGWNMVGFTSMAATDNDQYLKNWDSPMIPDPIIFGWDHGCFAVQAWDPIVFGDDTAANDLIPGEGYWIAFPSAGSVFQVVP